MLSMTDLKGDVPRENQLYNLEVSVAYDPGYAGHTELEILFVTNMISHSFQIIVVSWSMSNAIL